MLTLGYAADPGGGGAWIPPYPVRSCIRDLQPAITTKPHALFLKTSVIAVQGDLFVSWDRLRPTPTSELRLSVRVAEAICFRQVVRAAVG
jgi:hypothetical protein